MKIHSINGDINEARPIAIMGMVTLCSGLTVFFHLFAKYMSNSKEYQIFISWSGFLSMFFAVFMYSPLHDQMLIISSVFGLITVAGIIREIYLSGLLAYKVTGVICIFLLVANNIIYYSTHFIEYLPMIQKITLVMVLLWILGLNSIIRRKIIQA